MGDIGLNVAKQGTDIQKLLQANVQWIRIVADKEFDPRPFLRDCHLNGIGVMMVFDSTTYNQFNGDWHACCTYWKAYFGVLVDIWCPGNEPDAGFNGEKGFEQRQNDNPSSWIMHGWQVNTMMQQCRQSLGDDEIIYSPGLCSGRADWLDEEAINLEWVDGVSTHLYGQGAPSSSKFPPFGSPYGFGGDIGSMKRNYLSRMRPGQKFVIGEWGVQGTEIPDNVAEMYCERVMYYCREDPEIAVTWYFCEDDVMVGRFGLFNAGRMKPVMKGFMRATSGMSRPRALPIPTDAPPVPPLPRTPRFQQGFEKLHAMNPQLFGDPKLYDEFGAAEYTSTQLTTQGVMVWCWLKSDVKLHQFIANSGRVFRWIEGTPTYEEIFPH